MRVSNGLVVTDVVGICESWASFCQDLFKACPVDLGVQSDLLDCVSFSLSVDDALPFLFATLAKMGFSDSFIRWVRLLYTDVRSSVLVIGYTSRPFKPSRGVRQGCPLSPLLYVLSMEVLAANVRCHPDITGLRLPGLSSPLPVLSLYADDTSAVSCSDRASRPIFSVYGRFEQGTGAKLNLVGVWLGSWRGRLDAPVPIKWTTAYIKLLGVYLGNGNLEEEKLAVSN